MDAVLLFESPIQIAYDSKVFGEEANLLESCAMYGIEMEVYLRMPASTNTTQPRAQLVPIQTLEFPRIIKKATAAQKTTSIALRMK